MLRKTYLVLAVLVVAFPALAGFPSLVDSTWSWRAATYPPVVLAWYLPIVVPSSVLDLAYRLEVVVSGFVPDSPDPGTKKLDSSEAPELTTMAGPVAIDGG